MFGSLDPAKILVVLVIALIVLGPERLPRAARSLGAYWREFTRIRQEISDEVRAALPSADDLPQVPRIPSVRGSLTRYITEPLANGQAANGHEQSSGSETSDPRPTSAASTGGAPAIIGELAPAADDPSMN